MVFQFVGRTRDPMVLIWYVYAPKISDRGHIVFIVLYGCLFVCNFNIDNNFANITDWAFILGMQIPCDNNFQLMQSYLTRDLHFESDLLLKFGLWRRCGYSCFTNTSCFNQFRNKFVQRILISVDSAPENYTSTWAECAGQWKIPRWTPAPKNQTQNIITRSTL